MVHNTTIIKKMFSLKIWNEEKQDYTFQIVVHGIQNQDKKANIQLQKPWL